MCFLVCLACTFETEKVILKGLYEDFLENGFYVDFPRRRPSLLGIVCFIWFQVISLAHPRKLFTNLASMSPRAFMPLSQKRSKKGHVHHGTSYCYRSKMWGVSRWDWCREDQQRAQNKSYCIKEVSANAWLAGAKSSYPRFKSTHKTGKTTKNSWGLGTHIVPPAIAQL